MFHCTYDRLQCCVCNRFCYKWVRKQVSSHLEKHYLKTIKALWCCAFCVWFLLFFWFFFSITEENKQSLLWWGLPVLLLLFYLQQFYLQDWEVCTQSTACWAKETPRWQLGAWGSGAETKGAGGEKSSAKRQGAQVTPTVIAHQALVYGFVAEPSFGVAEPCFGVAPGTNMALPRGAMLGLIWAGVAGTNTQD